ncbi:hypothetical protein Tco_1351105, partial [Tanacetum coccineum]
PTEDVLPWPGNANMAFDLRPTEDVLPWPGNANMAFDLRPTEDVLPWPGNANMAFDLRPTEDVLPWLVNGASFIVGGGDRVGVGVGIGGSDGDGRVGGGVSYPNPSVTLPSSLANAYVALQAWKSAIKSDLNGLLRS